MTPAGRRVQLARYRISTGTRGLYAQRIDGRVAVVDVPIDHPDHVHLVERHVHTKAELAELAADGLARGRARVTDDELEDLVDVELALQRLGASHAGTSSWSWATGTRSSRPRVLCVQ